MKLMPRRGEMQEEAKEKKKRTKGDIASLVILIVLAVILVPIFAINLTLIIKGSIDPDVPPDVFGVAPMAVTTGSMDGDEADSFAEGALIFVRILDEEEKQALQEGDIVTFRTNGAYVTHRIVTVNTVDGAVVSVTTKGDANNANDGAILLENVVGLCTGSVAGMGSFAMFLQTPVGILVVVGVPVLLYIVYDVTRITLTNRRAKAAAAAGAQSEAEKDEEIRRLRELLAEKEGQAPAEGAERPEAEGGTAGTEPPPKENENSSSDAE